MAEFHEMFIFWLFMVQVQVVYSVSVPHINCPKESSNVAYRCQGKHCIRNDTNVENAFQNVVDNSTVIFCSKSVMLEKVIQISNKSGVSLHGFPGMYTEINCQGIETGFQFFNISNFTLSHFLLTNCGNPATDTMHWLSGVWFHYSENLTLTNITVRNSHGTGVTLVDATGFIVISDSTFENNTQTYYYGGGVHIKFTMIYNQLGRYSKIGFFNDNFNSNSNYSHHKTDKSHGRGGGLGILFEDDSPQYTKKIIVVSI